MPWTVASMLSSRIRTTSWSVLVSVGSSTAREVMPTSTQRLRFMRTYVAEAGSSPTSTVARQGVTPVWPGGSARRGVGDGLEDLLGRRGFAVDQLFDGSMLIREI
jgi:hypothetical protein